MKFKPKNDVCGVPGKYIKAEEYNQEYENQLVARAKRRGFDVNVFMLTNGYVPVSGPQLEIQIEEAQETEELPDLGSDEQSDVQTEKPKRKRRTKAEIEADKG